MLAILEPVALVLAVVFSILIAMIPVITKLIMGEYTGGRSRRARPRRPEPAAQPASAQMPSGVGVAR
jgi:hypothetical protein